MNRKKIRVAHFADIHFRSLSRHAEYKRAFEMAFEELKELKPDVILIAGDIVHSKTQGISPELIDHLTWWFNSMVAICPVHVILGNHDGLVSNASRQDAISPIVTALNNPDIHLYKKSGVYQFAPGFNWCVFSIFDEEGWRDVKPVPGDTNIALYHGVVTGGTTDHGFELEAEFSVSSFDAYDIVMLGDIHAHQYLAYRNNDPNRPYVAYPGSSIQQSYGETAGKGYLLWDINDRDDFEVKFKRIQHDQEFWTIDWKGTITETLEEAKKLPPNSRIRVRSDALIPHVEIKQLTTELTKFHGASEVVFKDDYVVDAKTISADDITLEKQDLRNVDNVFKLFKGYFGVDAFRQEEWDVFRALINRYITKASADDDVARNVRWSLKDLQFDNTFGYGEGNSINFKDLSGVTGIFGPNRAGKSSLIGTLLYTLFNGTDRGSIKNLYVINTRKSHCRSRATFSIGDKDYSVDRQTVKRQDAKGSVYAVTSLNFAEVNAQGHPIRDLNGEQRTDTEKAIRLMVGNIEDCLLASVATQGDMNRFIDAGSTHRDQIISRFLDLVIFDKMSAFAKDDSAAIREQVKNAPDRDWDALIKAKGDEMLAAADEIATCEVEIDDKRLTLDDLRIKLAMLDDVVTSADIDASRTLLDELRLKLSRLSSEDQGFVILGEKLSIELASINAELAMLPVDELKEQLKAISSMKDTLARVRQRCEKEKQVLSNQEKSVARLSDVPCGDSFPSCKYICDSHADKSKLILQRQLVEGLLGEIANVEASVNALDPTSIETKLATNEKLLKRKSQLEVEVVKNCRAIENIRRDKVDLEASILSTQAQLDELVLKAVASDEAPGLKAAIAKLQAQVDDLDKRRVRAASKKGSLYTEITTLQKERDTHKKLRTQWRIYEMFLDAVSKKGIPAQIVSSQLPIINAEISKILHGIVDYTLRLEKDSDTNTTEIYIDYGDSRRLIELASGMEKMIASLAIRVALQNASSLPRPDFLVVDEGFGSLDEMNVEACNRLLVSLKHWFKNVIVISHVDAIKDVADNIIEVQRVGKDTFINVE